FRRKHIFRVFWWLRCRRRCGQRVRRRRRRRQGLRGEGPRVPQDCGPRASANPRGEKQAQTKQNPETVKTDTPLHPDLLANHATEPQCATDQGRTGREYAVRSASAQGWMFWDILGGGL